MVLPSRYNAESISRVPRTVELMAMITEEVSEGSSLSEYENTTESGEDTVITPSPTAEAAAVNSFNADRNIPVAIPVSSRTKVSLSPPIRDSAVI